MRVSALIFLAILFPAIISFPIASAQDTNATPDTAPFITIDPIGNRTIDNIFFINGTTNLAASDESLFLKIETTNFNPGGVGSYFSSNVSIQPGENGFNLWSCNATTDRWVTFPVPGRQTPLSGNVTSGEYVVQVISLGPSELDNSQTFFLLPSERNSTPGQTSASTTIQSPSWGGADPQPLPTTTSPNGTPFPWILSVMAIFVVILSRTLRGYYFQDSPR